MLRATLDEPIPLQILTPDGRSDLFARVRVYSAAGVLVQTLSPVHVAGGLYSVNWTPVVEGYFTALFELFHDAGLTVSADYDRAGEAIEVSSDKTNLLRLLGLAHENAVLDQQVYTPNNRLASARLRAYDSKANAALAGLTGLKYVWTITATYDGQNRSETFKIERES